MTDVALIDEALKAAGVPIHGVQLAAGAVSIDYAPEATPEQRAAGDALLAGWDAPARERAYHRERAKASLASDDLRAVRCAIRTLYAGLVQTRQALNPLLTAAGRPALPTPTWAAFLQAVRQQIDAESDPEA